MKKNLKYTVTPSVMYVNEKVPVTAKEEKTVFEKGDLKHESRKVEIWEEKAKESAVLLTGNMDFPVEDLRGIYRRRWAIEMLYRQLRQNFQLHLFCGDTVNAIEIQTWTGLVANLLGPVIQQKIKRHCSFSQVVTVIRQTLMYCTDFFAFMENPNQGWQIIAEEHGKSPPETVQYSLIFE
jgi:IS4 transposase